MTQITWQVTLEYGPAGGAPRPGYPYGVVEREDGRTIRAIASGLTQEEAHTVANCREAIGALQALWDAVHREDHEDYFDTELVGDELRAAFNVLTRSKGVRS